MMEIDHARVKVILKKYKLAYPTSDDDIPSAISKLYEAIKWLDRELTNEAIKIDVLRRMVSEEVRSGT